VVNPTDWFILAYALLQDLNTSHAAGSFTRTSTSGCDAEGAAAVSDGGGVAHAGGRMEGFKFVGAGLADGDHFF